MAGFINAIRATLGEMIGADDAPPPALPEGRGDLVRSVLAEGVRQLIAYQGPGYAQLYLDRLRRFSRRRDVDDELLIEIARLLTIRMSYPDPIRIAQQVLWAAGVGQTGAPVRRVVEVHTFRIEELVSALPGIVGEPLFDLLEWLGRLHMPVRIRFSTASRFGIRRLKMEAGLRRWRLLSMRYRRERALTERWLHMIDRSLDRAPAAVFAVARTAEMLHGFGGPFRYNLADWSLIMNSLAKPVFDGVLTLPDLAGAIERARGAAKPDLRQAALQRVIAEIKTESGAHSAMR